MNKYMVFAEKFKFFKTHSGMFVVDRDLNKRDVDGAGYDAIVAFISGMDFFQGAGVMQDFRAWMSLEYGDEHSVFHWPIWIEKTYVFLGGDASKERDLIAFIFERIDAFLASKHAS